MKQNGKCPPTNSIGTLVFTMLQMIYKYMSYNTTNIRCTFIYKYVSTFKRKVVLMCGGHNQWKYAEIFRKCFTSYGRNRWLFTFCYESYLKVSNFWPLLYFNVCSLTFSTGYIRTGKDKFIDCMRQIFRISQLLVLQKRCIFASCTAKY